MYTPTAHMGKLKPRDVHPLPQVPQLLLSEEMKPKHSDARLHLLHPKLL